jgi:hypothetical protein
MVTKDIPLPIFVFEKEIKQVCADTAIYEIFALKIDGV